VVEPLGCCARGPAGCSLRAPPDIPPRSIFSAGAVEGEGAVEGGDPAPGAALGAPPAPPIPPPPVPCADTITVPATSAAAATVANKLFLIECLLAALVLADSRSA
jgi:hypothetical protein